MRRAEKKPCHCWDGLINGILEYSRVNCVTNKYELTDVNSILKEIVDLLEPPSHIEIKINTSMPQVAIPDLHIKQVLSNLINNAIKYNDKPKGCIDVDVSESSESYQFVVRDNGLGIDEARSDKVFELFQTLP